MTIKDHPEGKIITLSKPFGNRSKISSTYCFVLFFISGTLLFYSTLKDLIPEEMTENSDFEA